MLFITIKGGKLILKHYGNSHRRAIISLFPDLNLKVVKFCTYEVPRITTPHSHSIALIIVPAHVSRTKWKNNLKAQRVFFDSLASQLGFHPTRDPARWYGVTFNHVIRKKVFFSFPPSLSPLPSPSFPVPLLLSPPHNFLQNIFENFNEIKILGR